MNVFGEFFHFDAYDVYFQFFLWFVSVSDRVLVNAFVEVEVFGRARG